MPATRCTCIRVGLQLDVPDPDCTAPSHLVDALAIAMYLG